MVKHEVDVALLSVQHLLQQGVNAVLIVDNCSSDGTFDALLELARGDDRVFVGRDPVEAFLQPEKMTFLGRVARGAGADWILPFDADEFWHGDGEMSVAETLRSLNTSRVVRAPIYNAFPTEDVRAGRLKDAMLRLDVNPSMLSKVTFRSHPLATVGEGNHSVSRWGYQATALKVVHVPWRTFDQFERKVLSGSRAIELATGFPQGSNHWRAMARLDQPERLQVWSSIISGQEVTGLVWSPKGPSRLCSPVAWSRWDNGLVDG